MNIVGYAPWAIDHVRFEQVPFKALMCPVERPLLGDEEVVTAYRDGVVTARSNRRLTGYTEAADLSSYKRVEVGDLVVHGLDILAGAVGVSDSNGAVSPVCTTCVPNGGTDPRFVSYVIRTQANAGFTQAMARGIRQRSADFRRWETLADLPIPAPTPQQQRRIADYIDEASARLVRVGDAVERQVSLAEEHLRSRASSILTADRGLPFTDLPGAVPAGFRPLWLSATTFSGKTLQSEQRDASESVVQYLKASNISHRGVVLEDLETMWASPREQVSLQIRNADIFVIEGGATAGKVAMLEEDVADTIILQNHVHCVRAAPGFDQRFLYWLLWALYGSGWYPAITSAVTFGSFPAGKLRALPVPDISLRRQVAIASELDELSSSVERLRQQQAAVAALLVERQRALTAAAVTGELTV
jgi:type I restriction enzyme S subunit